MAAASAPTAPAPALPHIRLDAILRPLGLITQPNRFGYYDPGALSTAIGVYMRDPAALTVQQGFALTTSALWSASATAFYLIPVGGLTQFKYLTFFLNPDLTWRYAFDAASSSTVLFALAARFPVEELLQAGTGYGRVRGHTINGKRLVVAFENSTAVMDLEPSGTPSFRVAGIVPPYIVGGTTGTTSNAALAAGAYVHYTAVLRRTYSDNVVLRSAPAASTFVKNTGGASQNVNLQVRASTQTKSGDYIDVYRTKQQTAINTGSDFYLAASVKLTSSGTQSVTFTDVCNDDSLGEALYTNSGVSGAAAANKMPPICAALSTFKGYTFYFGVTELPAITLRPASAIGAFGTSGASSNQFRTYGIGQRQIVGNITVGSPTITAVSAADLVGIVIGQRAAGANIFGTIIAINSGAGTITINANATATTAGLTINCEDMLEIDGVACEVDYYDYLLFQLGSFASFYDTIEVDCLDRVLASTALTALNSLNTTTPADSFTISRPYSVNHSVCTGPMTIRSTNGANWVPPLPRTELSESALSISPVVRKNMIRWSEQNNAEACPAANSAFVGSGEIYRAYAMRDCLLIFASDGCWRLSGTGGQAGAGYDWRIDPIDSTISLSGPRCGTVARDTFYGYTNRGFVSIDSSGNIRELSQGRIQDLMPGPPWSDTQAAFVFFDETNDEVLIKTELSTSVYVYNVLTDSFTQLSGAGGGAVAAFDGAYIRADQRIVTVNSAGIFAERATSSFTGAAQVDYQPVYGDNPFAMQQWQSMDLVFDAASVGHFPFPRFNGNTGTFRTLTTHGVDQARASFGVGRNTPAKATCIAPGWSSSNMGKVRFFGIALRKVPISIQKAQR